MTKQELVTKMQEAEAWVPGKKVKIDFGGEGTVMLDGARSSQGGGNDGWGSGGGSSSGGSGGGQSGGGWQGGSSGFGGGDFSDDLDDDVPF